MHYIRALIREDRPLVITILALVLFMKMVVPTGYMVGHDSGKLTISICTALADGPYGATIDVAADHGGTDKASARSAMRLHGLGDGRIGRSRCARACRRDGVHSAHRSCAAHHPACLPKSISSPAIAGPAYPFLILFEKPGRVRA